MAGAAVGDRQHGRADPHDGQDDGGQADGGDRVAPDDGHGPGPDVPEAERPQRDAPRLGGARPAPVPRPIAAAWPVTRRRRPVARRPPVSGWRPISGWPVSGTRRPVSGRRGGSGRPVARLGLAVSGLVAVAGDLAAWLLPVARTGAAGRRPVTGRGTGGLAVGGRRRRGLAVAGRGRAVAGRGCRE